MVAVAARKVAVGPPDAARVNVKKTRFHIVIDIQLREIVKTDEVVTRGTPRGLSVNIYTDAYLCRRRGWPC